VATTQSNCAKRFESLEVAPAFARAAPSDSPCKLAARHTLRAAGYLEYPRGWRMISTIDIGLVIEVEPVYTPGRVVTHGNQ
jgi:hypothetical protein